MVAVWNILSDRQSMAGASIHRQIDLQTSCAVQLTWPNIVKATKCTKFTKFCISSALLLRILYSLSSMLCACNNIHKPTKIFLFQVLRSYSLSLFSMWDLHIHMDCMWCVNRDLSQRRVDVLNVCFSHIAPVACHRLSQLVTGNTTDKKSQVESYRQNILQNTFQFQKQSLNWPCCLHELPPCQWCWSYWIYWQCFVWLTTQSSPSSLQITKNGTQLVWVLPLQADRHSSPVKAGVTNAWVPPQCQCKNASLNIGMSVSPISAFSFIQTMVHLVQQKM